MIKGPPPADYDDNPDWTNGDSARARLASEVLPLEFVAALVKNKGDRPRGSDNSRISLRVDNDVLERFRTSGSGWQTRMNEALRRAAS